MVANEGILGEAGESDDDGLPPPPSEEKDLLLMLEFLVDTLKVRWENLNINNMDPCTLQGQTCIRVKFLHFAPMNICEKDLQPNKQTGDNEIVFNGGKSLVFGLKEEIFENPPPVGLEVTANKQLPHGCVPQELHMGFTTVDITQLFKEVYTKFDEHPEKLPLSRSMKGTYELKDTRTDLTTAEMTFYIRLTCLGQNVVTEFQKGEPFLFKNKASLKIYECREREKAPEEDLAQLCPGWGAVVPAGKQVAKHTPQPPPAPDPDDDQYEDITVEINDSALSLKVLKSKRRDKPLPYDISQFCECNIPLPRNLVGGQTPSLSEINSKQLPVPVVGDVVSTGVPDGGVGLGSDNKIVFQVPQDAKLAKPDQVPVLYNVNTCEAGVLHGHSDKKFKIIQEPADPTSRMANDPERDVFVFRVIKRGKTQSGKANLKLEFRTPKDKIELPPKPPYMMEKAAGPDKKGKKKAK